MMKNRAVWVALLVLGVATLLMVFFVLPRIAPDTRNASEAVNSAADTSKNANGKAQATVEDIATSASEKMGRLTSEATAAVTTMKGLFAEGRTPAADAFATAKGVASVAVSALAGLDIPAGIDATLEAAMKTARENAAKALTLIQSLPDDPAKAAGLIAAIESALTGAPEPTTAVPPASSNEASQASDLPRFDVLRVEPDGSTVIAGNAAPGSTLEIVADDKVIASLEVDASGDFAAVLDAPLPPGDHSMQLRATDKDGQMVTSDEVATISVPTDSTGKLLAMVSKPGEASRLITLPESINSGAKQERVAASGTTSNADEPVATQDSSTSPPGLSQQAEIQVTAVEIEGERIFVAGRAPPGSNVRGFADETLIGTVVTDVSGHFVVDGKVSLSVGSHVIRAELLDASGAVAVRTSVPFERPEGEQVSVVAQDSQTASGRGGAMVPVDLADFERLRGSLAQAFSLLQGLYADGKKPALEELAAARSATEIGLKSIADFRPAATAAEPLVRFVGTTAAKAGTALAALQALPREIDAIGAELPRIAALIDAVLAPRAPAVEVPLAAEATASAPPTPATSPEVAAADGGPKTIEQAPLTESRNSVIIRRGDTLWQISRRVYGQGVRYTTIYLANADQIRNPDLIEPGQVFTVPAEALPDAEAIHRKRLKGEQIN
ncbi:MULTISPECIES: LysM peptidoglycan-binding domain-containing protein [Alphaproteobacteria]|uniref:Peptidoglycan-binding protein LysM n=2 Tax=Alphaproteobacteria TaxID=28211 RepID=A0A512HGC9_9HYPH|nr:MULTISPECIES: LysM peptidoglycan-binding domain-containing protein [Alphaproteobacteria]GEO84509.1 peptidoglycan-binding protein LysM [Ciceribacter naphthalenivorans]GLR22472.1 peptidoglycan-binding protein LysM [Ciceribacter naphthalenivorans]GLT05328.1 peptidoglycan-binding protein LysM [Sphingomonas psychrolutea]